MHISKFTLGNQIKIVLFIFFIFISLNSRADSPLTSTIFYSAYENIGIIKSTQPKDEINEKIMQFLMDPKKAIDVKLALINKLGWNISGTNNSKRYFSYLQIEKGFKSQKDFIENGSGHDLICYAYLKALDDYFDVKEALSIALKAAEKEPSSFSIKLIYQLIYAQDILYENSCMVYRSVHKVKEDRVLTVDMHHEAIAKIFEYMKGYEKYCD